ncbi:uncharacterized protein [Lepeophtheirus salmonis]|uniref:Uncharacterized protein n=1 Tax=Lepeophtheirus salmonis TaxID=72036 RepID=A0A0K2TD87_LEPSM|nr:uncharacterized protein LOC121126178 [Lepeophtheirus salmonis]
MVQKKSSSQTISIVALLFLVGFVTGEFNLEGSWKEDQYKREHLNDFLYAIGMSWFKRVYVTSTSWENTQNIEVDGDKYHITGVKGPHAESFDISFVADNITVTDIPMGSLGGVMDGTAELKNGVLYTYLANKETGIVEMKISRKMIDDIDEKPAFEFKNVHIPSGVVYKAVFIKQN